MNSSAELNIGWNSGEACDTLIMEKVRYDSYIRYRSYFGLVAFHYPEK